MVVKKKRKATILASVCAFCMFLVGGIFSLMPKNTQNVDGATAAGSYTVSTVDLHPTSGGATSLYLRFHASNVLSHDLGSGLTQNTNAYIKDFADQLIFNGEAFNATSGGGLITTQGSQENWLFQKRAGANAVAFEEGDWMLIPQGTVFKTSTLTFTFDKNYKLVYSSTACPHNVEGIACAGSGKCLHGFHIYTWQTTSATVVNVSLNQWAGGKTEAYLQFWSGPSAVLNPGFPNGQSSENNSFLRAFADKIKLNGEAYSKSGKIVAQGTENVLFQKKDGSEFRNGDTIYIPYGTTVEFLTNVWTFDGNYKIVAASKTCAELSNCQAQTYCRSGYYHVYKWANGAVEPESGLPIVQTLPSNKALLISAMTKTNGTVGIIPVTYNTQGYGISFDMLDCYGAGFGVVIGSKSNNNNSDISGYQYLTFKSDGTTDNTLGYTGTFQYKVGHTYKFVVEGNRLNLYERMVLESNDAYTKVLSANLSLNSWNSIGIIAISDANRSATAIVDNLAVYKQNGEMITFANCDASTPAGWTVQNTNGKGNYRVEETFMYKVAFFNEKGQQLSEQSVCANGRATEPTDVPSMEGYEFIGWSDDYSVITADVAIHPVFKKIEEDSSEEDSSSDITSSEDSSSEEDSSSDVTSSEDSSSEESSSDVTSSEDSSSEEESSSDITSSEDSSSEEESSSDITSSEDSSSEEESSSDVTSSEDSSSEEESSSDVTSSEDSSSEEESSSDVTSSEDSSSEESSSDITSSEDSSSEEDSSSDVTSSEDSSSEEESSSDITSSEDSSSEEESSSDITSSEDSSSEEDSSSDITSSEDSSSEEESSSDVTSSEDSSSEEESSVEDEDTEDSNESSDVETSTSEDSSETTESAPESSKESSTSSNSITVDVGCGSSVALGVFPVLTLLGLGIIVKGRKE